MVPNLLLILLEIMTLGQKSCSGQENVIYEHFNMTEIFATKMQIPKVVLKSSNKGLQRPEHDF